MFFAIGIVRGRSGKVGSYAIVDAVDAGLSKYTWHKVNGYAARWDRDTKRDIRMHAVIAERMGLAEAMMDHKNGVRQDNRRSNLRPATTSQNAQNRWPRYLNTSGYRGVYWCRHHRKWAAQVKLPGGRKLFARFNDVESAAQQAAAWRAQYMTHAEER